jgi:hypothetical protein
LIGLAQPFLKVDWFGSTFLKIDWFGSTFFKG